MKKAKVEKAYRYYSLVIPLKEVLPPDGLLHIVREPCTVRDGTPALGYVLYDHTLPQKVARAYMLVYGYAMKKAKTYPPLPLARNPDEVASVLKALHPELYPDDSLVIPPDLRRDELDLEGIVIPSTLCRNNRRTKKNPKENKLNQKSERMI